MRCTHCAQETPIVESRSYLTLTFGTAKRPQVVANDADQAALRTAGRVLGPFWALNWHGAGDSAGGELFPGLYPGVEINDNHPDSPRPPLVDLQAELYFCSTACLRHWLNHLVDQMERMLAAGEVDTQQVNPAAVKQNQRL